MTLNAGNLVDYGDALATIGNALTETGDILLYGCNVAQGECRAGIHRATGGGDRGGCGGLHRLDRECGAGRGLGAGGGQRRR